MSKIVELGYIEKGTGKHQSNTVYSGGGLTPTIVASGVKYGIMIVVNTHYARNTHTVSTQITGKEYPLNNS